jgi:tRNA nucleotidyltransferase (CCA-adding enzyme)
MFWVFNLPPRQMKNIHSISKKTINAFVWQSSDLLKFGSEVYSLLVENFPQTFFVGGAVRDAILNKKISDIDICTSAKPSEVVGLLKKNGIKATDIYKNFGVIIAKKNALEIEIATFRKDSYKNSRYPSVEFVDNPNSDSKRRDFTINSLYLSTKTCLITDFHNGFRDIKKREIRFIGIPKKKITEDPLRIIRALRFAMTLNFKIEKKSFIAIKNNFNLIESITQSRLKAELEKIKNKKIKKYIKNIAEGKIMLDKRVISS